MTKKRLTRLAVATGTFFLIAFLASLRTTHVTTSYGPRRFFYLRLPKVLAQQVFNVACSAGLSPVPAFLYAAPTGNLVANACVDVNGNITLQPQGGFGALSTINGQFYVGAGITTWAGGDFGAQVLSAIAACPTLDGYSKCTINLLQPANGSRISQSTTVNIVSPYLSIRGPGSGALQITCTMNADCWNVHITPFVINPGFILGGFALSGTGAVNANAVGLHIGDIIGARFTDIALDNFRGANSACLWIDNVNGFFERNWIDGFDTGLAGNTQLGCTKGWKFTNSNGTANSASLGHNHFISGKFSVLAGQTGFSFESGAVYDSTFIFTGNVSTGSTGIVLAMSGTTFSGSGVNTILDAGWDMSV